jgi:UDP-N-acetylmuramoyl-L-alanyl-D-glutamate--2,6-diaminopimelate ligase
MLVRALYEALPECVLVGASAEDISIRSVTHDSRSVGPAALFCAVRGEMSDGHDHAPAAVAGVAAAILAERPLDLPVPQLVVPHTRPAMGLVADAFHGHPSGQLDVVGVTGTNGKTTVVHLLAAVLSDLGVQAGVIGTLTGVRTTPEAPELQAELARFVEEGVDAVAMEVSSHALAQHRTAGTRFALTVFTNLSQDHLDFHGTMDQYFEAKAELFGSAVTAAALVNRDDPWGRRLLDRLDVPSLTYGLGDAEAVRMTATGTSFVWRDTPVVTGLVGAFNLSNTLAAAEAAVHLGYPPDAVAAALGRAGPVPGRFEPVATRLPGAVVVDYAHTPDGLAAAIEAARNVTAGSVIVVFGCGGDRDRAKRASMGEVATAAADRVVVTSDNPRSEDPGAIIEAIVAGDRGPADLLIEPDRREAIRLALEGSRQGDTVLLAGKGHEATQTIGDLVRPFDDRVVASELAAEIAASRGADSA